MDAATVEDRFKLIIRKAESGPDCFADDVFSGLQEKPKTLPSKYFYDHRGSLLFDDICVLKDYYLTRAEREILESRADEIAELFPDNAAIVELGSGNSQKTRLLIESFLRRQNKLKYDPIDISRKTIEGSAISLLKRYPDLEIQAVAGDYTDGLDILRREEKEAKLILWLGSSIGNLSREDAVDFLKSVQSTMEQADRLLVGIDLRKSKEVLESAYDDIEGVTARFNRNILHRINNELGGDFDLRKFAHRALYDEDAGRVEMHLVCTETHTATIRSINLDVPFQARETIHTESCYKYSLQEIDDLIEKSGLVPVRRWLDSQNRFCLTLSAPAE